MPNETEFSYVIFTEQRNFTKAEWRNGNGRTATEWWKPGISSTTKPAERCVMLLLNTQIRRQARQLIQRYYEGSTVAPGKFQRSMMLGNTTKETTGNSVGRPKAVAASSVRRVQSASSPVRQPRCIVAAVKPRNAWDDTRLNSAGQSYAPLFWGLTQTYIRCSISQHFGAVVQSVT